MKLRKAEVWAILITAVFLALTVGWQLGTRRSAPAFRVTTSAAARRTADLAESTESPESGRIDLNTATAEEFKTLSGIGDVLAERIVAYRAEHGPFARAEDIMLVEGIGTKTYEANVDRITVGTEGETE